MYKKLKQSKSIWLILSLSFIITACGGGGGSSDSPNESVNNPPPAEGSNVDTDNPDVADDDQSTPPPADNSQEEPAPSSASLTLSWTTPTERQNGDELDPSEIGGYEIAYKLEEDEVFTSIVIDDIDTLNQGSNAWSYVIEDLESGNYEVKIATFDTDNTYGDYSEVVKASSSGS